MPRAPSCVLPRGEGDEQADVCGRRRQLASAKAAEELREYGFDGRVVLASRRQVLGGMDVNVWDVSEHVQPVIGSRQRVDVRALTGLDTPLQRLVADRVTP